jgi:hypothetical protein
VIRAQIKKPSAATVFPAKADLPLRSFPNQAEATDTPDLEARLGRAERFGHHFSRIKVARDRQPGTTEAIIPPSRGDAGSVIQRYKTDGEKKGPFTRQNDEQPEAFRQRMAREMAELRQVMKDKDENPDALENGDLTELPSKAQAIQWEDQDEDVDVARKLRAVTTGTTKARTKLPFKIKGGNTSLSTLTGGAPGALEQHLQERAQTTSEINANAKMPTLKPDPQIEIYTKTAKGMNDQIASLRKEIEALGQELPESGEEKEKQEKKLASLKEQMAFKENKLPAVEKILATKILQQKRGLEGIMNPQGHLPFWSHAPGDSQTSDLNARVDMDQQSGTYRLRTQQGHQDPDPRKKYAVVVPFSDPTDVRAGESHDQLAKDQEKAHRPVSYAGSAFFNQDRTMRKWNNDTGHYKTHPGFAHQAGPMFPLEKFRPLHIDRLRKKKLTAHLKQAGSVENLAQELGIEDPQELTKVLDDVGVDKNL